MPDKRGGAALHQKAFLFAAHFTDGTRVDLAIDADFETADAARQEALRYTPRLGRLPTALRSGVDRLVVHRGGKDTTAFSDVGLIVLYSENATDRIGTHDLEETVFHESVHAAWDKLHRESAAWREAQASDGRFVTDYAARNVGEDLAESALFAYTLTHHPERIPPADAARIREAIPARIEFVARLVPAGSPLHYPVEPEPERVQGCTVDLTKPGMMSDIVSNALMRGLHKPEDEIRTFLAAAKKPYPTGDELLVASAERFEVDEQVLREEVRKFEHCNCTHAAGKQTNR